MRSGSGTHRRARVVVVAAVVALTTFGIPGDVVAKPPVADTLTASELVAPVLQPGRSITRTVALPWRANMVGMSFEGAEDDLRALVRGAGDAQWVVLDFHSEDRPDGAEARRASARSTSEPIWLGLAGSVEVQLETVPDGGRVRDVRLHLINTVGDAHPASIVARAASAVWSRLNATPAPAQAIARKPAIISRAEWGADESWRSGTPTVASEMRMVFVHHTDTGNTYKRDSAAAVIRAIYRYHTQTRGYSDIAYNFLVDRFGNVYEGRSGGIKEAVVGAHTLGFNTYTTGIALVGTFTSASPPKAMVAALVRLTAWKLDVHHVRPDGKVTMTSSGNERYASGTAVRFHRISGHRDAKPTACPGATVYTKLRSIRSRVEKRGQPKIYAPRTSTEILRRDGDGVDETIRFTARFGREVAWTFQIKDSAGVVRRRVSGAGTSMKVVWAGAKVGGTLHETGVYRWRLDAERNDKRARPAKGSFYLVSNYPDGTLFNDGARFFVTGGQAYDDAAAGALLRSHVPVHAVKTGPGTREMHPASLTQLLPREGTLFEDQVTGARYIWSNSQLRKFRDEPVDVFEVLGYDARALLKAPTEYLGLLPQGDDVQDTTSYPSGTIVRDATNALWVVGSGVRHPISRLAKRTRYRRFEVVAVETAPGLPIGERIGPRNGAVVRAPDGSMWIIEAQTRRLIRDNGLAEAMGYTTGRWVTSSWSNLNAVPEGPVFG